MAQADFDFITNTNGGPVAPAGGWDGTSFIHSSLSSPLAGYGTYGRIFHWTTGTNRTTVMGAISAIPDAGVWVGTPSTHALSARATVRMTSTNSGNIGVGVALKSGRIDGRAVPAKPSGYLLFIGKLSWGFDDPGGPNNLTLHMGEENPQNYANPKSVTIRTDYPPDAWYRIRMDVIPSAGQDTILIYTSPPNAVGSEVWTLEHTETVYSTDLHYCNWGDASSNKVGYFAHTGWPGGGGDLYIDGFEARREAP